MSKVHNGSDGNIHLIYILCFEDVKQGETKWALKQKSQGYNMYTVYMYM